MLETIKGSIYDYPVYYDLLFGSDWKAEFTFLEACFARYAGRDVTRVFEPACGTGRLLVRFAAAGYEIGGNDLNPRAIEYCNARLTRRGFSGGTVIGDMTDFRVRRKFHAAFNTINSFRHLGTESQAVAHLECMAGALATGGLYVLGLHLLPTVGEPVGEESWSARRGNLAVNTHMWTERIDRRGRMEHLGMTMDVYTPTRQFRIRDHMQYRTYTRKQFAALLAKVPDFETVAVHDFAYDMNRTVKITSATEDILCILRRR